MTTFRYKIPIVLPKITLLLIISLYFSLQCDFCAAQDNLIKIEVTNHSYQIETVGTVSYYVVIGEVRNNNTRKNVEVWKVEASFYDEQDNFLGTAYSYTPLKILRPGEQSPFMIYWHVDSTENLPAEVKLVCLAYETDSEAKPLLEIRDLTNYTNDGYFIVSGKAYNVGPSTAYSIKIYCVYYDADGNILLIRRKVLSSEVKVNNYVEFTVSSNPYRITPSKVKVLAVALYKPKFEPRVEIVLILAVISVAFIFYMKKFRGW